MELSLIALAGAVIFLALVLLARRRGPAPDLGEITLQIRSEAEATSALQSRLDQALATLGSLSGAFEERRAFDERSSRAVEGIQRLVIGSYSKGRLGENLLEAALGDLPPEMVARDFTLGGRVCEFALRMDDGKLLPVDSKWTAAQLVEDLEGLEDMNQREAARRKIESLVSNRVREVAGYINPSLTIPLAVLAVPDDVYGCCRKVHSTARALRVTVVGYSNAMPILLSISNLYRAYGREMDAERVAECIHEVTVCLGELGDRLEGHLSRGLKQATNAVDEMRTLISKASATLGGLSVATSDIDRTDRFDFKAEAV